MDDLLERFRTENIRLHRENDYLKSLMQDIRNATDSQQAQSLLDLRAKNARLREAVREALNEKLKAFARKIIADYCWACGDPDGGSIQELAEKLGLIEPHVATEEDVDPEFDDYEVGDTIYKFTDVLKEATDGEGNIGNTKNA